MKALIVIAHPDRKSFGHAKLVPTIKFQYKKLGYDVEVLDLYLDGYNPSSFTGDISNINNNAFARSYRHAIKTADHVFIVSPTRWLSLDPLIEGFIDQVFTKGFAYDDNRGLLGDRKLRMIVISTLPKSSTWKTLNILWIRLRVMIFPMIFKYNNIRVYQIWNVKKAGNLQLNKHLHNIKKIIIK
ncbi:NAD(P)H-dependent oxidoreductase [bacterium]|nr:NAD(P)H-dependent oxidoreductase [bacterium]